MISNQVRQFYVVTPANVGDSKFKVSATGDEFWFTTKNALGEAERSNLIKTNKVCSFKCTTAEKMQRSLKEVTIDLTNVPVIVGQDYVLHVNISGFISGSEVDSYMLFAAVHVVYGKNTLDSLLDGLIESFNRNTKGELNKFVEFSKNGNNLVITEVEQPWRQFWMPSVPIQFEVIASPVIYNGDEYDWVTDEQITTDKGDTIKNGKTVADMEYFYHGERGDQNRLLNWPNNIDTKYLVDPEKEYDIYDIHYYYSGDNHAVQKSEQTLTIAVEKGADLSTEIDTNLIAKLPAGAITVIKDGKKQ